MCQRSVFVLASISVEGFKSVNNYTYKIFNVRKNIRGSLLAFGLDPAFLPYAIPRLLVAVVQPGASRPLHNLHHLPNAAVWDRTRAVCVGV
jgi:hypothetical protein